MTTRRHASIEDLLLLFIYLEISHHYLRREKSDPIANRELPGAMLNPSKSAVTVPAPRQQTLGMLKSP
jgi:hypothetical protein